MKGIVGVIASEHSRYTRFWTDLHNLETPDGVSLEFAVGGTLGMARNTLVQRFLQTDAGWLCMIDDDHAISPLFLRQWLFTHETKLNEPIRHPIVASLYLMRGAPFSPTLYGAPLAGVNKDRTDLSHFSLKDFPTSGVTMQSLDGRLVYAAGASGMFVRRDVYEKMPPPWYELGQSDNIGEDFWFCVKAQRLGYRVYVDLDSRLGHLTTFAVWPDVINGEWITSIRRDSVQIGIDAAESAAVEAPVEVLL